MRDFASDLSEFSLLIWTFRADLDWSSSNALSLRVATEGRRRRREEDEDEDLGVCFEAVKNW